MPRLLAPPFWSQPVHPHSRIIPALPALLPTAPAAAPYGLFGKLAEARRHSGCVGRLLSAHFRGRLSPQGGLRARSALRWATERLPPRSACRAESCVQGAGAQARGSLGTWRRDSARRGCARRRPGHANPTPWAPAQQQQAFDTTSPDAESYQWLLLHESCELRGWSEPQAHLGVLTCREVLAAPEPWELVAWTVKMYDRPLRKDPAANTKRRCSGAAGGSGG